MPIIPRVTPLETPLPSSDAPEGQSVAAPLGGEVIEVSPLAPLKEWEDLGLSPAIIQSVRAAGYERPTPVQGESIPVALTGRDLIASAQTGTGKTASFVLPIAEKIGGKEGTLVLVLSPTREIAQQTNEVLEKFGGPLGLRTAVLIGGVNMRLDTIALQNYPQIIVATPGRLCDHLDRGNIWLDYIKMVVLDEADRMLDMGFADQLARIMEEVPESRQTMIYSATFPPSVERLARKILRDPARVAIGKPTQSATLIEQRVIHVTEESKNRELIRLFREETGSIIVFTRTKDNATRLWRSLHSRGIYEATYIHSDRLQAHREQALAEFKEGKFRILIATDVAARGIHVDNVAHVINYELPMEAEDYIHRIGRTGRSGATGKSTTFATPRDRLTLQKIEKLLGKKIPEYFLSEGPPRSSPKPEPTLNPDGTKKASPITVRPRTAEVSTPSGPQMASNQGPVENGEAAPLKKRRRPRRKGGRSGNSVQPAGAGATSDSSESND